MLSRQHLEAGYQGPDPNRRTRSVNEELDRGSQGIRDSRLFSLDPPSRNHIPVSSPLPLWPFHSVRYPCSGRFASISGSPPDLLQTGWLPSPGGKFAKGDPWRRNCRLHGSSRNSQCTPGLSPIQLPGTSREMPVRPRYHLGDAPAGGRVVQTTNSIRCHSRFGRQPWSFEK